VRDIHSHIEPIAKAVAPVTALDPAEEERLRARILVVANEFTELGNCNRLHIRPGPAGYDVVLHCLADPDLSVEEAHRLADQLERHLQTQIPGIQQVLVHVEPEGETQSEA
jgi:divalent metal cation (Fe/Co/Zn/Cd) transporter